LSREHTREEGPHKGKKRGRSFSERKGGGLVGKKKKCPALKGGVGKGLRGKEESFREVPQVSAQ